MLHIGRCGSTVLSNMLKQHPSIHWKGEFFNKNNIQRYLKKYNTDSPFRALWLKSGAAGTRSFGFEVKAHPVQHPSGINMTLQGMVEKCVSRIGCRHFILLTRDHLLRRFVSYLAGRKRKQWNFSREETVEEVKVHVPTGTFQKWGRDLTLIEFLELFSGIRERWKSVIPEGCDTLDLEYAHDILHHPETAYHRAVKWLRLEKHEAEIANRKLNRKPLNVLVENWDEVRDMLGGTRFEWMLSDEGGTEEIG